MEAADRYDIKGRSYIETPKKYYFSDLGLRNARINFRQFDQTHAMENAIYNELRMRGYSVDVGVITVSEKDGNGKSVRKQLEVDFVCNLGSKRYYIQSAYSLPDEEKRQQEIRPFRKIDDSFKKIVITKDIVPAFYDENGILTFSFFNSDDRWGARGDGKDVCILSDMMSMPSGCQFSAQAQSDGKISVLLIGKNTKRTIHVTLQVEDGVLEVISVQEQ